MVKHIDLKNKRVEYKNNNHIYDMKKKIKYQHGGIDWRKSILFSLIGTLILVFISTLLGPFGLIFILIIGIVCVLYWDEIKKKLK